MMTKMTLSAAVLAASLIATQAMAQEPVRGGQGRPGSHVPPPPSTVPGAVQAVNPSAFNAIAPIRVQWDQARATYLQAQQAELVARANFDRANTALLNVMSAATQHLPTAPMPVVIAQPVQGQPVPAQPPRP